jgi:hypothetical protein
MMSMETKGQPGAAPAASLLQSSQSVDPFRVFCVSTPPRHKIARGGVYIVDFRPKRFREAKVCSNWNQRGKSGPY